MKNKLLILFFTLKAILVFGQCTNPVSNLNGSAVVNNVNVTVTSLGLVSTYVECGDIGPYWVGKNGIVDGYGSYTFHFSPPITGFTLSFSGLDNYGSEKDEIELSINGNHYPITAIGDLLACTPLAVLNSEGNIIANPVLFHGGWRNNTIYGVIESLTVANNVTGVTAGATFSLNICDPDLNTSEFDANPNIAILYPNPFNIQTEIHSNRTIINPIIIIYDALGQVVKQTQSMSGNIIFVDRDGLSNGIYYLKLLEDNKVYFKTKLSIRD